MAHADGPVMAQVSVCFSPGPKSCADLVADTLDDARASIRMQAYWLTSQPVLRALRKAREKGVDVQVILDRSQDRRDNSRGH